MLFYIFVNNVPSQTLDKLRLLITPPFSFHRMTSSLKIVFCDTAGPKWLLSVSLFQPATVSDSGVPPVCCRHDGWQQPPCLFFFYFFDICGLVLQIIPLSIWTALRKQKKKSRGDPVIVLLCIWRETLTRSRLNPDVNDFNLSTSPPIEDKRLVWLWLKCRSGESHLFCLKF